MLDSGLEQFRTGGIHEIRDSGLEGYKKVGIQERRVQDRRYAEQERCWKGGIQESKDRGMQKRRNAGQERCMMPI